MPSTLIPYANFFVGFGNPQPLVDGNNAGILKNVGINFETDALTGFPKLDDTGSNTFGGAIGLEYLFNLDQQLVFEVAMVQPFEDDGIGAQHAQYGFGVRYQIPINRAWLFRADATYQILAADTTTSETSSKATSKTTSASAPRSAGSSDRSLMTAPAWDGEPRVSQTWPASAFIETDRV